MLYQKPDLKYTEMAKYVDEHMWDDPLTSDVAETIFLYLYHMIFMQANVDNIFSRGEYYEKFAIWLASDLYRTFTNKSSGRKKVKSSLNYIKKIIKHRRVNFEKENYAQTIVKTKEEDTYMYNSAYSLADKMVASIESQSMSRFDYCLDDITLTAKEFLKQIPYRNDRVVWNNIYTSCLLTLMSSVVLSREVKEKVNARFTNPSAVMEAYAENEEDVVLYHLPDNMREYIRILTREIKHVIAKDVSLSIHAYVPSEDLIKNLIISEVNDLSDYENWSDE